MAIGGLSNLFAMTQMQQNDVQTTQKLVNMGVKAPTQEQAAKIHKEHPEMGLADIIAQNVPKDDAKLSEAVKKELAELHAKNGAIAESMKGNAPAQSSSTSGKGGLTEIMSKVEAQQADFKKAQGISGQIQNDQKMKVSDSVNNALKGFAGGH
jgi:putative protein kinase ArgK-like GTPase of G3E family